ncbi:MAG TPA: hypothetical protein VNG71_07805 [Pyrinomonadaceae bacterium]|nr:hypothetical protein [Pyrinomonadaceae bacterium]
MKTVCGWGFMAIRERLAKQTGGRMTLPSWQFFESVEAGGLVKRAALMAPLFSGNRPLALEGSNVN